jgi:hypothetical protein
MIHARARWLEPIGQIAAFLAFSIQFFYVDPASYGALRAALDYQAVQIDELGNKGGTEVGNAKETKALVERREAGLRAKELKEADDSNKQAWRFWLFVAFMLGAILTIVGKAASVRYSTKT